MIRDDLIALTPDVLAALSNRGLVKRATREVDAGERPALTEDADGAVRAAYPDGVTVTLPPGGGLTAARCSCPAPGVCRHLLAVVLTYQRTHADAPAHEATPDRDAGPDHDAAPDRKAPPEREVAPDHDAAADHDTAADRTAASNREAALDRPAAPGPGASRDRGAAPGREADGAGGEPWRWSPGDVTDEDLAAAIGAPALTAARRQLRRGYTAVVHRPDPADPVPRVELPTNTVRFLVPHQIGYARGDAADDGGESIALAVWACRAADRQHPDRPEAQVRVGGPATVTDLAALDAAVALAADVLLTGAAHLGSGTDARLAAVRRDLDAAGLRWPLLAVDDLAGQLEAYAARGARYRPENLADLVAELPARRRAVVNAGATPPERVLGAHEPAETPLRRLRLTGLGARVRESGGEVGVDVVLAHPAAVSVLVLHRAYPVTDDGPPTGHELAGRRVTGTTLGALATGNVVSESAVRSAAHRLRFAAGRLARTTVTPGTGEWSGLPPGLLARDPDALAAELAARPPRLLRPRAAAESVRVLALGEVRAIGYAAGEQRLHATVTGADGGTATLTATHHSAAPGALDALAAALDGTHGPPRYVSGTVRRGADGLVVEPLAVVADAVVVPDLAPGVGDGRLAGALDARPDPVAAALGTASALLAQAAHSGLRHLPAGFPDRLRATAAGLTGVGLDRCGAALSGLAGALGADPGEPAVRAWVDAWIRLSVTAESR
ncbi:SWIM zinc finger family protein [Micromonospora sp. C32]|uniref:SWIM zinc finger family protein n=1 Tax=Micromonospora sp. C32 TaxID=2824877 RepID=UPI001B36E160|nr:SWIM zinc finger family protein [Micromonospora sp. C32]MBQ1056769.1 SWIM zinc finger family protein [Micromonospora sp. C32]